MEEYLKRIFLLFFGKKILFFEGGFRIQNFYTFARYFCSQ